ncbi:MAG: nicotinate-nucleotide adenylyltransferase [Cyanobacteria bacterium J06638_7]
MTSRPSVALLGTSADPPTPGHQALLEGLLEHFPRVATWASDNPMKDHGAPLEQRAALLAAVVTAIGDPRLELVQDLSSPWAISTLERAARRWPEADLVFVVGSDLAAQIPRWKQASALLHRCRLAVVPRAGWPLDPRQLEALRGLGATVQELPLRIPATTSSQARLQPAEGQVAAAAWPLLLDHNLYGLPARP